MRVHPLGDSGPVISQLGYGCLGLAGGYGPATADRCESALRYALDLGITLFDTADFYAAGAVERTVGRAVAGRRDEVVLATRGGVRAPSAGAPPSIVDGRPDALHAACDASLRRLGVEHIDLYYLARVDPAVPVEDSVGALADLRAAGKIRYLGLSEVSAETLARAHQVCPVTALSTEYSLWERHVEADILPAARRLGIGLVAHTPLGKGFLAAALTAPDTLADDDHRRNHPRFVGDNFRRNRELVDRATELAAGLGVSTAQLAICWLLSRGTDVVPIPGSLRPAHLDDNVAATDLRIPDEALARLDAVFAAGHVAGSRHPAHRRLAQVDRDG